MGITKTEKQDKRRKWDHKEETRKRYDCEKAEYRKEVAVVRKKEE